MPYSVAFYDIRKKTLVAGRGEELGLQESYANLFYGKTPSDDIIFSNNESILQEFVDQVFPVAPYTYYSEGEFFQYTVSAKRAISDEGIKANYTNARDLIGLINGLLKQTAHDSSA